MAGAGVGEGGVGEGGGGRFVECVVVTLVGDEAGCSVGVRLHCNNVAGRPINTTAVAIRR